MYVAFYIFPRRMIRFFFFHKILIGYVDDALQSRRYEYKKLSSF